MGLRSAAAFATLLGLAPGASGTAQAVVDVEFVWVSTTGSGTPGGSSIDADPGDELVGEIRISADPGGIFAYGVSLEFDPELGNELDFVSATEGLGPFDANLTSGLTWNFLSTAQESSAAQAGRVLTFEAVTYPGGSGPTAVSFIAGTMTVLVTGNVWTDGEDVVTGTFHTGVDGVGNNALQLVAPNFLTASVNRAAPPVTRTFSISGTSDETPWSWRISPPETAVTKISATDVGPVPNGQGPFAFVGVFVASIDANSFSSGCDADSVDVTTFQITCPGDFRFYVNDAPGTGTECEVTGTIGGSGCSFNPTIVEVASAVPALTGSARVALAVALLLLTGYALRRRLRVA
jgi:hypothetical protein